MYSLKQLDHETKEKGGLIVSCQPVTNSPLDKPDIVAAMALAAQQAGACAIRIEGVANLQATRSLVTVPIIGLIKRDYTDSPIRITALLEDVEMLSKAGADIIAFDGTNRPRPFPREKILAHIHRMGLLAMADCSNQEEGLFCQKIGTELIGTTMSGYISEPTPETPDLALVATLSAAGCRVVAEGRYNTPALAAQAITHGAWAVTVGSAITRLEHICHWYLNAIKQVNS
ncbi:N-acetylmannosamine-6-phosphate 2-epimerase [Bartonella sp. DGB2]|uniref:N-acetylmannosamine-6-phosphate 2-epimerase n=1 Tax=Bartonella sp. DGB2 TaxID=3388426 RepID=UPI00398FDF07